MNADQLKVNCNSCGARLPMQTCSKIGGNYENFVGKVQERYGVKKSEVMKCTGAWHQKSGPEAIGESRADAKSSRGERWITE